MSDIGERDYVECIDNSASHDGTPSRLVVGSLYMVDRVYRLDSGRTCGFDHCEHRVMLLIAKVSKDDQDGYCVNRFKPIYRPDEGLFRSLKMTRELENA